MIPNLARVMRLAQDETKFDENKHPRKDNGQFGSGGSSGAPAMGAQVSSTITGIMKAGGYKKQSTPGPNGTTIYYHPSGAKITVHPAPEGKKWSSKWTSAAPGKTDQSGEGSSLAKLLRVAVEKAEAKKNAVENIKAEFGEPTVLSAGVQTEIKNSAKWLETKGYKPIYSEGPSVTYSKNNPGQSGNGTIEYNAQTGAWVAQTHGHMTKEGTALHQLAQLFEGKIEKGVTNSSKIPKTAENAAAIKKAKVEQTKAAAHVAAYKKLQAHAPTPAPEEASALSQYGGSGYSSINNALRHKHNNTPNGPTVKALDEYLNKSSLPEDFTVYRGVKGEFATIIKSVVMLGTKFVDRGFISTSASETFAKGWAGGLTMKMNLKKGQKGAAIGSYSGHKSEYEVLLPRGSALIVTAYDPANNFIEVEVDQAHL